MTKKKKKIVIIICISVVIVVALPFALMYGAMGLIALDLNKKPDHSDDRIIPSGYVQTDGKRGYGAGDHEDFCYYVYDNIPELDRKFSVVANDSDCKRLKDLFEHYSYDNDDDNERLNSNNLTGRISDGDYYYIADVYDSGFKYGGLVYYYDTEENTLYRLDYIW